ncbi:MAG: hypothetical protein J6T23_01420 [Elusimicrobia bacterium]|nr:hypothetical protein [Elusimicrobiota bacterium]
MLKKYLNNKGFGLVELLIIVIIVISLSAVSFNYYKMTLEKSKVADAMAILRQIADSNIIYYRENRMYTDDITKLLIKVEGEEVSENGYKWTKTELFSYRADNKKVSASPSNSNKSVFELAYAKRDGKYEIYVLYDEGSESLRFDASASTFNDAGFIDGKIVEIIQEKGRL